MPVSPTAADSPRSQSVVEGLLEPGEIEPDALLAEAAERKGEMQATFDLSVSAMHQGNGQSMVKVASFFLHGWNVVKIDYEQAFELLQAAHQHNVPRSAYLLACCFGSGCGVAEDKKKADELLSADLNDPLCRAFVGASKAELDSAVAKVRKLAAEGDHEAQYALARMPERSGLLWRMQLLITLANKGHAGAQQTLGDLLRHSPSSRPEQAREAVAWFFQPFSWKMFATHFDQPKIIFYTLS